MLNRYTLAGLGALFVLALVYLLYTSEEDRIREQLEQIRALGEIRSKETAIEQLAKAREIGRSFSGQTLFDLRSAGHGTLEIGSRDELVRRIIRGRARLESLELTLQDIEVDIEADTAEVRVQGSALGLIKGEPDPFLEIHSGVVMLRREADTWRVTGARHLRDERRP
jgi:hypothetical protein